MNNQHTWIMFLLLHLDQDHRPPPGNPLIFTRACTGVGTHLWSHLVFPRTPLKQ